MEWRESDYYVIFRRRRQAPNSSIVRSLLQSASEFIATRVEKSSSPVKNIRSSVSQNQSATHSRAPSRSVNWNHKFITFAILIALLCTNTPIVRADQEPARAHPALLQLAAEHPGETFMVIIQREMKNKNFNDDDPDVAIEKAGGKVKKQLQMIESFSAELTGKEIEKLAKNPKVRWISFDAPLVSTAVGDPTVRDEFNTVSFANNQGSVQWLGNWIENDPETNGAGASAGQVQIANGALRLDDNPDTGGQPSAARQVNLSSATAATLSFNYRTAVGVDPDDAVVVEVSNNGGSTYSVLETFTGFSGEVISSRSYNISTYLANTTTIRFRVSNNYGAVDEYFYADNVQVEFVQSSAASLATGLAGYWNFDVNANDYSDNNYHGTATNGAAVNTTSSTNKIGSGKLSVDGVNDFVDLSIYRTSLATLSQGTVAMWIKTTSTQDSLFNIDDTADTDSVASLWINLNGQLAFDIWQNNVRLFGVASTARVNDGLWHHVAFAVDSSGNKLYIDGVQVPATYSSGSASSTAFFDDVTGIDTVQIGRDVNYYGGRYYYNGLMDDVRLYNRALSTAEIGLLGAATPIPAKFLSSTRAVLLQQQSPALTGQGIGVAVVDSGITSHIDLQGRIVVNNNQTSAPDANDNYVHGTHVAGIIAGNGASSSGMYKGVAPGANLINVKVSNDQGVALMSDLIDGLQWILSNKTTYNIRVVNISLNSTVAESYHTNPLNAAVEILWFNGVTVVVAAGNNGTGNNPVTLYPPANDPFVITVGATEDKGTTSLSDDKIANFSAFGTTENGFAKPDLVTSGRSLISLLSSTSATGYINHPVHRVDNKYFRMTGTSMAAPVVSGAVALLLQDEPGLTPDQVKYRLKATANTAWGDYNSARAGAGALDIYAAINGTTTQSANTGQTVSTLLTTGSGAVNSTVNWNSVNWNSVNWNSVNWNSVNWNSVNWNSSYGNSSIWDDQVSGASVLEQEPEELATETIAESTESVRPPTSEMILGWGDGVGGTVVGETEDGIIESNPEDETAATQRQLFLPFVTR